MIENKYLGKTGFNSKECSNSLLDYNWTSMHGEGVSMTTTGSRYIKVSGVHYATAKHRSLIDRLFALILKIIVRVHYVINV